MRKKTRVENREYGLQDIIKYGFVTLTIKLALERSGLNYTIADVYGPSRKQDLTDIRRLIWKFLTDEMGYNQYTIAQIFSKHHVSISVGIKDITNYMKYSKKLSELYQRIKWIRHEIHCI